MLAEINILDRTTWVHTLLFFSWTVRCQTKVHNCKYSYLFLYFIILFKKSFIAWILFYRFSYFPDEVPYLITYCFTDGIAIKASFACLYKFLISSLGLIRIYWIILFCCHCVNTLLLIILNKSPRLNWNSSYAHLLDNV